MSNVWKYIRKTSFSEKREDVKKYLEYARQAKQLHREAVKCSLELIQSYNYFDEDRYPSCIEYIKANTEKGAIRGQQLCKKFNHDCVCSDVECPAQLAQSKYVAARAEAEKMERIRKEFWPIMMAYRTK